VFIPQREHVFERYLGKVACRDCPLPLVAGDPPPPHQIRIESRFKPNTKLGPDALRAIDTELKSGISEENIGGTRAVH
jgi:hypothetical protein